ncbi:hypothetical protein DZG01_26395 [Pseudomonas fluorescens]|nr:hypothetical protein DZG01_26395 [Pseudomonas fluorescens]
MLRSPRIPCGSELARDWVRMNHLAKLNAGLSSNCHISAIECSHGLSILCRLNTPYLLGVRHETEAFDGGNDFCRCWRCDCQRGCRC